MQTILSIVQDTFEFFESIELIYSYRFLIIILENCICFLVNIFNPKKNQSFCLFFLSSKSSLNFFKSKPIDDANDQHKETIKTDDDDDIDDDKRDKKRKRKNAISARRIFFN